MIQVSFVHDFVGRLAEKYPSFILKLGRLETRYLAESFADKEIDRPIFITGLARSGTTILLELLASHIETGTHQYRDFPLLHIPIWWNWFLDHASHGNYEAVERTHEDGITVTPDSPEAMEEILWMSFFSGIHDPRENNILGSECSHPLFENFYLDHIKKMLFIRKGSRYLVKGNYNISRIAYINRVFPDARFIIPVRNPVNHIASLMKQHRLFGALEEREPKVLAYMRRAGHFEFGLDRRAINFGSYDTIKRIEQFWRDGDEIRGWAAYWSSVYEHVGDIIDKKERLANNVLFIHYSNLCEQPLQIINRLYQHCELEVTDQILQEQASRIRPPDNYDLEFSSNDLETIYEETNSTEIRIRSFVS